MNANLQVKYEKTVNLDMSLDVQDYLKCDTVSELYREVRMKLRGANKDLFENENIITEDLTLPDEFVETWKKQVGFIEGNVMTERLKNTLISCDEVYTKVYTGREIKNMTKFDGGDSFDLRFYRLFNFDENTAYKCWLIDNECSFYWTNTTLWYCEKMEYKVKDEVEHV